MTNGLIRDFAQFALSSAFFIYCLDTLLNLLFLYFTKGFIVGEEKLSFREVISVVVHLDSVHSFMVRGSVSQVSMFINLAKT